MRTTLLISFLTVAALVFTASGCDDDRDDKIYYVITNPDVLKDCELYIPTTYDNATAWPLLLSYHGNAQYPLQMTEFWQDTAENNGFILCSVPHTDIWTLEDCEEVGPGAVKIRDEITTLYNIDNSACYLNGFSGGGIVTFWAAIETPGWAGMICFSSNPPDFGNTWSNASGPLPIYWKNAKGDFFFPEHVCQPFLDRAAAEGHNVHGVAIWIDGSFHDLLIQNPQEVWDWITDPANKP